MSNMTHRCICIWPVITTKTWKRCCRREIEFLATVTKLCIEHLCTLQCVYYNAIQYTCSLILTTVMKSTIQEDSQTINQ